MRTNENPAPRANAGSRANSKAQQRQINSSAVDWEGDAPAIWFAPQFPMPSRIAHVLAALASLGRAFG